MDLAQAYDPGRALGVALRLLRRAPLTLLLGGFGLFLCDVGPLDPFGESLFSTSDLRDLDVGLGVSGCIALLVYFPINALLQVSYPAAVQRVLVTGEERPRDLLRDRGLWTSMLLARAMKIGLVLLAALPLQLVLFAPVFLGRQLELEPLGWVVGSLFALAYLPIFVYVSLGFLLVEETVAIESRPPVEAVQRSWELVEGHRVRLALYFGALLLVRYAGAFLCCVTVCLGWFLLPLARTWTEVARCESFLRLALPEPEGGAWADREP